MNFFIKLAEFWREAHHTDQVAADSIKALESDVEKKNQLEFLVSYGILHMGWRGGLKTIILSTTIKFLWMKRKMFLLSWLLLE